jgi:uncharacterized SAM-binding protein YcdF (DUF218 family)
MLAYPLTQVFLLQLAALVALLRASPRLGTGLLAAAVAWLYIASTPLLADRLLTVLEQPYPPVAAATLPEADAIILLGGGVHERKAPNVMGDLNRWSDRLLFTASLYQQGKAPVVLLSGGGRAGRDTDAAMAREILEVMGVPAAATVLEERSRNTRDNAVYSAAIVRERGWQDVLLVTSALHMRRASALFEKQGVNAIPAPTDHRLRGSAKGLSRNSFVPTLAGLTDTHYAMHELAGYLAYGWLGWL